MFEKSNYYFISPEKLEDRLDFRFNHPFFEEALAFIEQNGVVLYPKLVPFVYNGSTPSKLPNEEVPDSDKVLFIKNENVKRLYLDLENKAYISRSDYEAIGEEMHIKKDDILFSMTGTLGNACLVNEEIEAAINQNIVILRCNPTELVPTYAVRFLNSEFIELQVTKNYTSAQTPYLNVNKIKKLKIIKPSVQIQRKITEDIMELESQARELDQQADKLNEECRNIILNELGIQIPPEDTANYFFKTSSETRTLWFFMFIAETTDRLHYLFFHPRYHTLTALCDHYSTIPLSAICREPIVRGEQPDYDELGTVTVFKTVDLHDGYIDYGNTLKVSDDFFVAHPASQVRKNDILIASTGYVSMGKVDIYDRDEPAMVDGHISIVRINEDYDPFFVAYFLRSHFGRLQFEKWFTGSSGQIELQPTDLGEFLVPDSSENGIPLNEQRRIAKLITERLNKSRDLEQQAKAKWQEAKEQFIGMIFSKCTTQQEVP